MRLRGDLHAAEKVALAACEELHDFERLITAGGYYEVGEIRRRLGDFAAAEEAYRKANELGSDPQPGLALLRLAEGKLDAAVAAITRTPREVDEPLGRLRRLPAQVEIAVAARRPEDRPCGGGGARAHRRLLQDRRPPSAAFDATVHSAPDGSSSPRAMPKAQSRLLRRARDQWKEVGAPYETAQARLLLGMAFRRQGDEHAATAELEAALATFERLGAKLDEQRVKELLGRQQARRTFVFTDIVGSTRLLETLGDDKWKKLLARHNELLRERIVEAGGEVVQQTGDGFFAAFDNPKAAIEAAIAIQRALEAEIVAPDVRIGAHTGGAFGRRRRRIQPLRRRGRSPGSPDRRSRGSGRDPRQPRDARRGRRRVRLSEPRAETFKGFEQPVEVVSVDWR